MCRKQERMRLEMWLEKKRLGSNVTPRLRTEASEVKVMEEELLDTSFSRIPALSNCVVYSGSIVAFFCVTQLDLSLPWIARVLKSLCEYLWI